MGGLAHPRAQGWGSHSPSPGGSWGTPAAIAAAPQPGKRPPRSTYALEVVGGGDGGWAPGRPEWADHRLGEAAPSPAGWGQGGSP